MPRSEYASTVAGGFGRRAWERPSTAVVVGGALVDAGAVAGDLAGAGAVEGGERAAHVWFDPYVDHRDVAEGVHRAGRAGAGRILAADHDRLTVGVEAPAQVIVHVPLHQRTAPVEELGIGERHPAGREHRRDQRALVAVDLVDERFGLVRIEERVVGM